MGFLKFLKREKKKEELDELDLPPAPPPLDNLDKGMADMPEFEDFGEKISAPPEIGPKFDLQDDGDLAKLDKEPMEFPDLSMDEEPAPPTRPIKSPPAYEPYTRISQSMEETASEDMPESQQYTRPAMERGLFRHEKMFEGESSKPAYDESEHGDFGQIVRTEKAIYVKVDRFKAALGSINMVRGDLRKSDEALMKLEDIKGSKERSFDKIRSSLNALQKTLIFVDKTLFKGE